MDFIRWFFAIPDPKEEAALKDDMARLVANLRRVKASPFWSFIYWCEDSGRRLKYKLLDALDFVWHGTLGRWVYCKCSRMIEEAATMRFVSTHTSIPVPRVWMSFKWGRDTYIFMKRIDGVVLQDAWDRLSEETKGYIAEQLREFVSQLRSLPSPAGKKSICSLNGGPVFCFRLHFDGKTGPFRDEEHMNLQLRHMRPLKDFAPIIRIVHQRAHPLVFTHNDLFPRNIMIEETTGKILAILDWESAGWFPAHWEYCKCVNWGDWRSEQREWNQWAPRFVPVYEEEAKADRALMYESGILELNPTVHA